MMKLSKRLQGVAGMVTPGERVADIGCDHAYTSIYLMKHRIAPSIIAMDVNKGPLMRAKENIEKQGLNKKIQTRISDGLQELNPGEVDTILIAGMGGPLTCKILKEGIDRVLTAKELVLQPQSEIHLVRRYLRHINFRIVKERMLIDDGKYYVIIKGSNGNASEETALEVFDLYGEFLLENKDPVLFQYLKWQKRVFYNLQKNLLGKNTSNAIRRLHEVKKQMALINEGLSYYSHKGGEYERLSKGDY